MKSGAAEFRDDVDVHVEQERRPSQNVTDLPVSRQGQQKRATRNQSRPHGERRTRRERRHLTTRLRAGFLHLIRFLKIGQQSNLLRKQAEGGSGREITFLDIFELLWERRNVMAVASVATVLAALIYGFTASPVYRAQVVLAPVSTDISDNSLPALPGGLSSLASLAGLGTSQSGSIQQNLAIMKSRALAEQFIDKYQLAPLLFPKRWDARNNTWNASQGAVAQVTRTILGDRAAEPDAPTEATIYRKFKDILSVQTDDVSGLVTLKASWSNPEQAARIANSYVNEANEFIRERHVAEADQRLRFLETELANTSLTDIQRSIYQLVANETKRSMIANVRKEFAFKIIDPAVVPEMRSWPNRTLLLILGVVGGVMLGIGVILVDTWLTGARAQRRSHPHVR